MSFIDKINRFATNPVNLNKKRSKFNLSHKVTCTLNSGYLVPLMFDEVLPGDTIKIDFSSVCRSITPALPVMDDCYLDIFAFWCPSRILTLHDKDWQKIHGENVTGYWAPSTESTLENTGNTFNLASSGYAVQVQSLADYFGFPIGFYKANEEFSRLPFNGYWEIWNEWFRDENTQAAISWKSYSNSTFATQVSSNSYLCKVNKLHDYFTSALPTPQKGASVLLPLAGEAPVITSSDHLSNLGSNGLRFASTGLGSWTGKSFVAGANGEFLTSTTSATAASTSQLLKPTNLWADLANATSTSVNDLRQAFAIQKLLEKDARGGTRYREMLLSHFGVSIPDNTVQVPEYLGGKRIPLNMTQVLQTSESGTSPLGTTGAFSNTSDSSYLFTKSFAEFGYIYILACIRPNQSYCQGINKLFKRNRRYDWYYPVFANLGEQAVKTYELYATNAINFGTDIFGYQEAWAEYRFKPNKISGYVSKISGDAVAGAWTYANYFTAKVLPILDLSCSMKELFKTGLAENLFP